MSNQTNIQNLHELKAKSRLGGGPERIETQHKKGRLTARERIEADRESVVGAKAHAVRLQQGARGIEFTRQDAGTNVDGDKPIQGGVVSHVGDVCAASCAFTRVKQSCRDADLSSKHCRADCARRRGQG